MRDRAGKYISKDTVLAIGVFNALLEKRRLVLLFRECIAPLFYQSRGLCKFLLLFRQLGLYLLGMDVFIF